jgi:hypothetical protein
MDNPTCICSRTFLLGLFCLASVASPPAAAAQAQPPAGWTPPEIRCPLGKAPVLDGVVAKGEWDDALVVRQPADSWPHDTMVQKLDVKYDPADLACAIRMKHDGARLYILCEITDDVIYKLDTEEWVPDKHKDRPKPCWKSPAGQEDWGYWGDCFEVGICASMNGPYKSFPVTGPVDAQKPGECWKVQGNISYGRVMAGEVLKDLVEKGHMQCAMKRLEKGKGYVLEWAIAFNPCMAVGDGKFYEPGKSEPLGMQMIIVDVDTPEASQGHLHPLINHQGVWPYCGKGPKKAKVNWARVSLETTGASVKTGAAPGNAGRSPP